MAAALARAAAVLDDVEIGKLAANTAGFAADLARRDPAIGAIDADARHYTWAPAEFSSAIGPEDLQAACLHFHMTRASVAHVIYQARSVANVAALGHSGETVAAARLCNAVKALAQERAHRPAPASVPSDTTACAAIHGVDVMGRDELGTMLADLAADRFDSGYGWRRSPTDRRYFLEDQAIALDAVQALMRLPASGGQWAALEAETFETVRRGFCGADGRLLPRHKDDDEAEESVALLDDILPSSIATFCVAAAERPDFAPVVARYGRWSRVPGPQSPRLMGL